MKCKKIKAYNVMKVTNWLNENKNKSISSVDDA